MGESEVLGLNKNIFYLAFTTHYFISKNDVKTGPFTLSELDNQHLTGQTMVWYNGLEEWTKANEILELLDLLHDNPPATKTIHQLLYTSKQIF